MKIRRTIALLTAFVMIAAMVPAMALTAFAEDGAPDEARGIVTADGMHAYKIIGENLISGGSFEGSDWGDQLTVGANHGNDGKAYTGNMAESGVWRRARLAADAYDGQYSLRLDSTTSSNGNVINDANKPASIKHYIYNDSSSSKTYFVRFYAMGPSSLTFSLSNVDENEESVTGTDAMLNSSSWAPVEGAISIPKGRYLLINVYNMSAGTYIDDFAVYEVTTDTDSRAFDSAMTQYNSKFEKPNAAVIDGSAKVSKNLNLIKSAGKATVTWESSRPDVIAADGTYTAPAENTVVTLTATISCGIYSTTRTYRVTAQGIADDVRTRIAAAVPYVTQSNLRLPTTLSGYDGSRITWRSSNTDVISNNGTYRAPAEQSTVTLTATFVWGNATLETTVETIVGTHFSMISNGTFDVVRDIGGGVQEIYDWTVGVPKVNSRSGVAPMTTENFEIQQETLIDENGKPYVNNFLVSKNHGQIDQPASIRRYIKLEPGKYYRLTYKVRYMGSGTSEDSYIGAYLVPSSGEELVVEPTSNFHSRYGNDYVGIYYKDGAEWETSRRLTAEDGWQTYETLLKPTATRSYLLIAAKWLNRNSVNTPESKNSDGRWGFDDFVLEEYDVPFYGNVTINYLDASNGRKLKDARVEEQKPGNMTFTASESDKDDITYLNRIYRYLPSSVDSVVVSEKAEENVINLYFRRLEQVDVNVRFALMNEDGSAGDEIKPAEKFTGYIDFEAVAPESMTRTISANGKTYSYKGGNSPITASANSDENVITLLFREVENIITNGNFATGDTTGWTNRKGEDIAGATVQQDAEKGTVLAFGASGTGGKSDNNNIGTIWNVEVGKKYRLSFEIYGTKLTDNNYTYNRITDAVGKTDVGSRDTSGANIYEYGKEYSSSVGSWKHMEVTFVAKTDTVYFQSSYFEGLKIADFLLYEVEEDANDNVPSFTTSVTINYIDRATGRQLKAPRVEEGLTGYTDGSASYTVKQADKNSITVDGQTYRYDNASVDTVVLKNGGNVINLYFMIYAPVSAEDVVIELAADEEPVLPTTVMVLYNTGTKSGSRVTSWDPIPEIAEGQTVVVNGMTAANVAARAIIKRFYKGEDFLPDDYDDYNWVGEGTRKYAIAKDAENIITNGNFASGDTTGWVNRKGEEIAGATVEQDAEKGSVLDFGNGTGGKNDANNIGTTWSVKTGKEYYMAFDIYGTVLEDKNYIYNRITDAVGKTDVGSRDTAGNNIFEYGKEYAGSVKSWKHMEVVFEAKTDTVYFQSSYLEGLKLANFVLYELVDGKYYEEGSTMSSRIYINYNGKIVGYRDVAKGDPAPNLSGEYLDCVIDYTNVDTNEPNGGTIYVTNPEDMSTISVGNSRVQVQAVGENIDGVLIIAQYDRYGALVDVETYAISVADGTEIKKDYTRAENAVQIRAMVVESLDSLVPILHSIVR